MSTAADTLDCSHECSNVFSCMNDRRAWLAPDIEDSSWKVDIDSATADEIIAFARYMEANPVQERQRLVADYRLEACWRLFERVKHNLDTGPGFALIDRLPIDAFSVDLAVDVYWVLGQLVGRPVAQKWNGAMLYSVRDTGEEYSYGVRGSLTNAELVFHNDNAFARTIPDYVGLLCLRPAKAGGISRICSIYSIHRSLEHRFPALLPRLYQRMLYDRQKEHMDGAPIVTTAPFFSWRDGMLYARANTSLVRKGYEITGRQMDTELAEALDAVDEVCKENDLWFSMELARGQVQYLNNRSVAHYRSNFDDFEDAALKRHLVRMWHRRTGAACYDGVSYP